MVGSIVVRNELERIEGKGIAAMIVHSLDDGNAEEHGALAESHTSDLVGQTGAKGVEQETLKRMVVQGPVGVRNIETMVSRVEVSCGEQS